MLDDGGGAAGSSPLALTGRAAVVTLPCSSPKRPAQDTVPGSFWLVDCPLAVRRCRGIAQESLRNVMLTRYFKGTHCEAESETVFAPLQTCLRRKDGQALFPAPAPSPPRRDRTQYGYPDSQLCQRAQWHCLPAELAPWEQRAASWTARGDMGGPLLVGGARLPGRRVF